MGAADLYMNKGTRERSPIPPNSWIISANFFCFRWKEYLACPAGANDNNILLETLNEKILHEFSYDNFLYGTK